MRAIQVSRFGGPEVLEPREVPEPRPGAGEVLVEVSFADIIFVETQIRTGWGREFFKIDPPYVPGFGVGGTVSAVGEGVDPGWVGRRVIANTEERGGYAERAVVSVRKMVPVPDGLELRDATALRSDGPTALGLMEKAAIRPGQWVLVTAAGGGMGVLLVQLAHAAGARVIGAARGQRKLELLRELGADVVVDYSRPDWGQQVLDATDGRGADVVFDGAGSELGQTAFGVTAQGGQFSAHGAPGGGFAEIDTAEAERRHISVRGIQQVQFPLPERQRLTEQTLALAVAGRLRPVIGQAFPLERAGDAHAALTARSITGKALLLI
ncbi:zinc-binding dehydrogenase [Myxococcus sp. CA056]|uniref:zinc-binding dehydrogenase n=1 Tax=unclassified Myxococcus TaxID=2648731 RepID=UPI00157B2B80|nr:MULTISPECIES: zinc-binding dehydrogenase [unclassified Myxococcus]NTX15018.1 zinc-binding dehydrogenase [Myxococcus sp. CA056]NTX36021.1 zinc-binding dehydrogenase [Myxococcus sp. CA033]